jgi:hypothetical protein
MNFPTLRIISTVMEMGVAKMRQSHWMTAERRSVAASSMALSFNALVNTGVRS